MLNVLLNRTYYHLLSAGPHLRIDHAQAGSADHDVVIDDLHTHWLTRNLDHV